MRLMFLLVGLLFVTVADAESLIVKIQGDKSKIELNREGKLLSVQLMSLLKTNDYLSVKDDVTEVSIKLDDQSVILINKNNSPYEVKEVGEDRTVWNNLVDWASDLLNTAVSGKSMAIASATLASRGEAMEILSVTGGDNLLLSDNNGTVYFPWSGGDGPYTVTLLNENGDELFKREVSSTSVLLPSGLLQPGSYYELIVEYNNAGLTTSSGVDIVVVSSEQLPEDVKSINNTQFSEPDKKKLMTMYLASIPEWRFQALQMAKKNNEEVMLASFLKGVFPVLSTVAPHQ